MDARKLDDAAFENARRTIAALGAASGEAISGPTMTACAALHPTQISHRVVRDLRYGPHPRHVLDVHAPSASSARARPVVVYLHGGGFTKGDKSGATPFYDNIGRWAVESGYVCVNMNYRLAPEVTFPAGADDLSRVLSWIQAHIGDHGGDPTRVVVFGHSAGASHVATLIASGRWPSAAAPRGAILSSGAYEPALSGGRYADYFGDDPAAFAAQSSIPGLVRTAVPILLSIAELDPPAIQRQTIALVDACVRESGVLPPLVQAEGHNHLSVVMHLGGRDTWLGERYRRFIDTVTRSDDHDAAR